MRPDLQDRLAVALVVACFMIATLILVLAPFARAVSPLTIEGTTDTTTDPVIVSVRWTSACNVTSLTPQTQQDDGAWTNGTSVGVPSPTSGSFQISIAKGHLWRIRVTATYDTSPNGGGCAADMTEPSNALEVDLRAGKGGLFGWGFCGLAAAPVPIVLGVVYVVQRRRRPSDIPMGPGRAETEAQEAPRGLP